MSNVPTWRDRVQVHPAAELFPMMSDSDLADLGRDIARNGLQLGVTLWTPEPQGTGRPPLENYLLDGRSRLEAIDRQFADNPTLRDALLACALSGEVLDVGPEIAGPRQLYGGADPWSFVISANIHRRHLTPEQRRDLIAALIKRGDRRSDRQIAKQTQASPTTVGKVRADLEDAGLVSRLDTRPDRRGREQPASKPPAQKPAAAAQLTPGKATDQLPPPAPSQAAPAVATVEPAERAAAGSALDRLLDRDLDGTLSFVAHRLYRHREAVEAMPIKRRRDLGRVYMEALCLGAIDAEAVLGVKGR